MHKNSNTVSVWQAWCIQARVDEKCTNWYEIHIDLYIFLIVNFHYNLPTDPLVFSGCEKQVIGVHRGMIIIFNVLYCKGCLSTSYTGNHSCPKTTGHIKFTIQIL